MPYVRRTSMDMSSCTLFFCLGCPRIYANAICIPRQLFVPVFYRAWSHEIRFGLARWIYFRAFSIYTQHGECSYCRWLPTSGRCTGVLVSKSLFFQLFLSCSLYGDWFSLMHTTLCFSFVSRCMVVGGCLLLSFSVRARFASKFPFISSRRALLFVFVCNLHEWLALLPAVR